MRILVADDDRIVRAMLNKALKDWGHDVTLAKDGAEAWKLIESNTYDLVVSDWLMPEMNGVELCQLIRGVEGRPYIYTLLLTSKSENTDLVTAFEAGADDFINKPVNFDVLQARIRAGERIIKLEHDLAQRNQKLHESNKELERAKAEINRDLEAGAALQRNLLPRKSLKTSGYRFEWIYEPCSVVSGDILNVMEMENDQICFYLVDVSGHGVPSALLTFSVNMILASDSYDINPLYDTRTNEVTSTGTVLCELNDRYQLDEDTSQYFTIVYGLLNTRTGEFQIAQAGHPSPVVIGADGKGELIGDGGFPIGWLPVLDYDEVSHKLDEGGRILLYTDGISECTNPEGEMFGDDRLKEYMERTSKLPLKASLEGVIKELHKWNDNQPFDDDVSMLAIERLDPQEMEDAAADQTHAGTEIPAAL